MHRTIGLDKYGPGLGVIQTPSNVKLVPVGKMLSVKESLELLQWPLLISLWKVIKVWIIMTFQWMMEWISEQAYAHVSFTIITALPRYIFSDWTSERRGNWRQVKLQAIRMSDKHQCTVSWRFKNVLQRTNHSMPFYVQQIRYRYVLLQR